MRRRAFAAFLLASLFAMPAIAQQQPRAAAASRPAWAADIPAQVPADQVGVFAYLPRTRPSFCVINVVVVNNTARTIRTALMRAEVFFGNRSVIGRVGVEFADPDRSREARLSLVEGCQRPPTRIVIRDMELCATPGDMLGRPACGMTWMTFVPEVRGGGASIIPLEFASDFRR